MGPLIMPSEDSEEPVDWERDASLVKPWGAPFRPGDLTAAVVGHVFQALRRAHESAARVLEWLRRGGILRRL